LREESGWLLRNVQAAGGQMRGQDRRPASADYWSGARHEPVGAEDDSV